MMITASRLVFALFLGICSAAAGPAEASPATPDPHQPDRQGGTFGLGFGMSTLSMDCQDCGSSLAGSVNLSIGYIKGRTAMLYNPSALIFGAGIIYLHSAEVRHWALPQTWLQAGLGPAYLSAFGEDDTTGALGASVSGAIGVDLSVDDFTFELSGRVNLARFADVDDDAQNGNLIMFSLSFGARWR